MQANTTNIGNENSKRTKIILDFLPTYRDVKRFINEFKFHASFIDNQTKYLIAMEYILLKTY